MKRAKSNEYEYLTDEEIIAKATPTTEMEKKMLELAINKLGEITTVSNLSAFLKLSPRTIYKAIEERRLICFKSSSKNLILTGTILNIIKEREH